MPVPGQGNSSYTEISALQKILAELRLLKAAINSSSGGSATEATLQQIEDNTSDSFNNSELQLYDVWDKIPGNSKELTWIDGNVGSNRLVSVILYKTGVTTIMTQTFAYDPVTDEVISITAS